MSAQPLPTLALEHVAELSRAAGEDRALLALRSRARERARRRSSLPDRRPPPLALHRPGALPAGHRPDRR